jgi:citrate lyase subunit beta/citryl-CoA lyase
MNNAKTHPDVTLFPGEKIFPNIPACEHFAGSEKLITKALQLQNELGPIFDITCDCEDGAQTGTEVVHAEMVSRMINSPSNKFNRLGVRIHDYSHSSWKSDVEIVVGRAGKKLAYVTIPKSTTVHAAEEMISYVQKVANNSGRTEPLPIHVLVETHGALRHAYELAELPHVEVLDFGLMDFVSSHFGAISDEALRSPGQFENALIARAKSDVAAAALAAGVVPAHNVCLNLKDAAVVSADAKRAHDQFGFQRMWSIHPAQIEPIVSAMKPSMEVVEDASAILVLAQDTSWGPIQYKGELHDRATYRYYWSVLKRAYITGVQIPTISVQRFFSNDQRTLLN